jgi:hypothetical protein
MSLSQPLLSVFCDFESAFSQPPWSTRPVRLSGPLFARGRRTVTAALRQMGLSAASHFTLDHPGLTRARGAAFAWSRRLLVRWVRTFGAAGGAPTVVIDETWARRWGRRLTKRGPDRAPLAASTHRSVATRGRRWLVLTFVLTPPWTPRSGALPVMSVPAPTPEGSPRLGVRHKTGPHRARQMILAVGRWWPGGERTGLGDQTDRVHAWGGSCAHRGVRWVAPRRLDAAVSAPVSPRAPRPTGRPRVNGARVPQLKQGLKEVQPPWQRLRVRWSNGRRRELEVTSGTGGW